MFLHQYGLSLRTAFHLAYSKQEWPRAGLQVPSAWLSACTKGLWLQVTRQSCRQGSEKPDTLRVNSCHSFRRGRRRNLNMTCMKLGMRRCNCPSNCSSSHPLTILQLIQTLTSLLMLPLTSRSVRIQSLGQTGQRSGYCFLQPVCCAGQCTTTCMHVQQHDVRCTRSLFAGPPSGLCRFLTVLEG